MQVAHPYVRTPVMDPDANLRIRQEEAGSNTHLEHHIDKHVSARSHQSGTLLPTDQVHLSLVFKHGNFELVCPVFMASACTSSLLQTAMPSLVNASVLLQLIKWKHQARVQEERLY